jgi:hypothetical protein
MIDVLTEETFSLTQAAKLKCLPRRRAGKRPSVSTLWRWSTVGARGVVLETIQAAGTRCTSREALARFFEALTYSADQPTVRTPVARRRAVEQAVAELERQGV